MTIREFSKGERFDHPSGYDYVGYGIYGDRKQGSDVAIIVASSRSSADDRDSIAAKMATLTESWTIETIVARREWRVTYRTTHRIVPIEEVQP